MRRRWPDAGLTLLELAATMAILSVLALMGVQFLTQGMSNQEMLTRADARSAALVITVAVLRRDLEQAIPQPDAAGEVPVFRGTQDALRFATGVGGGSDMVIWRVDPQSMRLSRELESGAVETLALADTQAMRTEIFSKNGWIDAQLWQSNGPADLPQGLRVVLTLSDLGDVPVVVAR